MFITELELRAIEKTFAAGVTLEKVLGADILDMDYTDEMFHVTEVAVTPLSFIDDAYVETKSEYSDEELFHEFLCQDEVEENRIRDYAFFFIDVYNGFTDELFRTWYCAWCETNDNE